MHNNTMPVTETIMSCGVQNLQCNKYSAPCTLQSSVTMRFSRSTQKKLTLLQFSTSLPLVGIQTRAGKDKEVHAHRAKHNHEQ